VASFGMRLKQEREKQSITLDDISLSTKISTRMLRALEEERLDQLPGGIFNKGFIRAYARCVGMDEDQAIADYLAATTVTPPGKKSENDDQPPILDPPSSRDVNTAAARIPWGTFAVTLLILALGFAAWGFYSRQSQKATPTSAVPATTPPEAASTPVAETSPSPNDSAVATDAAAGQSQPTVPPSTGSEPGSTPAANPLVSIPEQAPSPDLRPGRFVVLIKAREDSWLSVSVDGEVSTQGTLTAPAEKSIRATKEITIKAGNIGALDFAFNGNKLPAQGDFGEVKTLTFDANGLRPSAPQPPEPTPPPSPSQESGTEPKQ